MKVFTQTQKVVKYNGKPPLLINLPGLKLTRKVKKYGMRKMSVFKPKKRVPLTSYTKKLADTSTDFTTTNPNPITSVSTNSPNTTYATIPSSTKPESGDVVYNTTQISPNETENEAQIPKYAFPEPQVKPPLPPRGSTPGTEPEPESKPEPVYSNQPPSFFSNTNREYVRVENNNDDDEEEELEVLIELPENVYEMASQNYVSHEEKLGAFLLGFDEKDLLTKDEIYDLIVSLNQKSEDNKIVNTLVNKIAEFYDTEVDYLKSMMFLHWVLTQFIEDKEYFRNELKNHKDLRNIFISLMLEINKLISMIFNDDTRTYTFFTINTLEEYGEGKDERTEYLNTLAEITLLMNELQTLKSQAKTDRGQNILVIEHLFKNIIYNKYFELNETGKSVLKSSAITPDLESRFKSFFYLENVDGNMQFKQGKNPPANFNSLIIMPAQRIMRYPMYFGELSEKLSKELKKKSREDNKTVPLVAFLDGKKGFFEKLAIHYQDTLAERQFGLSEITGDFSKLVNEIESRSKMSNRVGDSKQEVIKRFKKRIGQIIGNGCKESLQIDQDKLIKALTEERLKLLASKDKKNAFKKHHVINQIRRELGLKPFKSSFFKQYKKGTFKRIKRCPQDYSRKKSCKVKSLKDLSDALKDYRGEGEPILEEHTLFPYCSELMSKFPKPLRSSLGTKLDKVNKPEISKEVVQTLSDAFMVLGKNIEKYDETSDIIDTGKSYKHKYENDSKKNVENFKDWIIYNTKGQNLFIVSHSNFMAKFLNMLTGEKLPIDNLDIIHIIIDEDSSAFDIELKFNALYRWQSNYSPEPRIKSMVDEPKIPRHIFIARHCAACHNHPYATLAHKQFLKSYGEWAMCFRETKEEISSRAPILLDLLTKYGGLDSYTFGSSIVFRAVLTGLIFQDQLRREKASGTIYEPPTGTGSNTKLYEAPNPNQVYDTGLSGQSNRTRTGASEYNNVAPVSPLV